MYSLHSYYAEIKVDLIFGEAGRIILNILTLNIEQIDSHKEEASN